MHFPDKNRILFFSIFKLRFYMFIQTGGFIYININIRKNKVAVKNAE